MNASFAPSDTGLDEVAEGVFAHVQPDGGWCLNNAGVLVSGGESALVDTAATEFRARRLRELTGTVAGSRPRLVVNTHFHGDHTFGNALFPESVIIAHERTRAEMLAAGMHLTTLWPDVCWGNISVTPPDITFREQLTLYVGEIQVELMHLGPAHTTDDTLVWLPEQRVLFAGDVVMSGVTPFVMMGSISGSLEVLDRLHALEPRVVVPGHGPVCDASVFDANHSYLSWVQNLARDGIAAGLSPIETARQARRSGSPEYEKFSELLDGERLVPNLHRAYSEARGDAPGMPLDLGSVFQDMVEFHGGLPACRA